MSSAHQSLKDAGWTPQRTASTRTDEEALASEGYLVWPTLVQFLESFSGLTIAFEKNGRRDSIWFSAEKAVALSDATWVDEYSNDISTSLAPVGCAYHDHLLILCAANGKFYGSYDDYLARLGSSPLEMVANLLEQRLHVVE
jgi:hypothetical protein